MSQLKRAREKRGLSQNELARWSGVDHGQLSRAEKGKANLSNASLRRVAQVLGLVDVLAALDVIDKYQGNGRRG
jgi:transcriptional regulator with XRE-family HTH domain